MTDEEKIRRQVAEDLGLEESLIIVTPTKKGGRDRITITIRDWRVMAQEDVASQVEASVNRVI